MDERERLEQATSSQTTGEDVSSETAPLRESWSSLTRLLNVTNPELDESRLVQRIQSRLARQRRQRVRRMAMAALLLISCGAAGWFVLPRGPQTPLAKSPPTRQPPVAATLPQVSPENSQTPLIANAFNDEVDALVWQDAGDAEILQVQWDLDETKQSLRQLPSPVELVQSDLEQLQAELEESTF